jgi:uncharacterized protein
VAIRLARNLTLPVDAQTETFALLAKRGAGKTYACLKMAEGMHDEALQFVFVDPTGVCWGLRSSSDGKRAGLPVLIFGGDRGDIPLEEGSGRMVADFIVDEAVSCILDLSDFSKGRTTRFMCDFAEHLYQRKNKARDPLHIFLDEADAFAPQRPMKDQARMLGAVEDLVRRGRSRGIGLTLSTQRSAVLNKNVLTQCETLIAMRVVAPQDINAVDEWLKHAGDEDRRQEALAELPRLETGQAVVWSPHSDLFRTVTVAKRRTFDSSATPKAGKRVKQPKTRADVDLDAVRAQMAETVERAEARDPKKLQVRVRRLEKELARQTALAANAEKGQEALENAVLAERSRCCEVFDGALGDLKEAFQRLHEENLDDLIETARDDSVKKLDAAPLGIARGELEVVLATPKRTPKRQPARKANTQPGTLPPAKQRIIDALAFFESVSVRQVHRRQLAFFAGASPKSSAYSNNVSALRTHGFVDYPGDGALCLTGEGRAIARNDRGITTTADLHRALQDRLQPAKWRILAACIDRYPAACDRAQLAETAGASAASSAFSNNVSALKTLGVIDYPGKGLVRAADLLFLEGS